MPWAVLGRLPGGGVTWFGPDGLVDLDNWEWEGRLAGAVGFLPIVPGQPSGG